MKKRIAALLCAAMMAVTLAACTSEGPGKEASEPAADSGQAKTEEGKSAEEITLGVSFGQNVHPFFVAMQKGIEKACEDYNVKKMCIRDRLHPCGGEYSSEREACGKEQRRDQRC